VARNVSLRLMSFLLLTFCQFDRAEYINMVGFRNVQR
jgi:hypothetical protein